MSFLADLNPAQREAVEAVQGPVMIVAGAGSGKTRVLTYRAAFLLQRGARPESLLALTFTNKAAEEMKSRIRALVGDVSRAVWMGTFHSLFARLLRFEAERLGYTRSFTIYDSDDSLALVRSVMGALGISGQLVSPQAIRSRISTAKNRLLTPQGVREGWHDPHAERAALIFEEYDRRLKKYNAMDFDDLLLKPLELFTRHAEVLQRYQHRFSHILVDEYQDTNRVQYRLLSLLAAGHRNICVVGDDAQSIYAFRGADIRNILDFEKDYPDCRIFRLEQNYRSTGTILAVADSLIAHNRDRIPKTLWTANPPGNPVALAACPTDRDEGYNVAARVEEEIRRNKRALKDFVVLYRTNAQSRTLEDALRRSGIPYVIVGGVAFYKRKEVKDILAYLRLLLNPRDEESLLRIINVPARGIGDTTIGRLRGFARDKSLGLLEAMGAPGLEGLLGERPRAAVNRFSSLVRKYLSLRDQMSASELARALVDELGILVQLKEENTPESLARRENILELVSALTEFGDTRPGATLDDFLQEVSLVSDVDTADFTRNAVTLMTLHAAKGLEFPVVFITGLEEGLFPLSVAASDPQELEEERRLMYVGLTRSSQQVYLSYAQTRYRNGEFATSVRSRFLDELDPAHVVEEGVPHPETERTAAHPAQPRRRRRAHAGAETDAYFSDQTPGYEDESQETVRLRVGLQVIHGNFGRGRVVALDGSGDNARAIVEFDSVGRKHLLLKFAHLRLP
jgi:DNA helicase-2/ATP-dependent DNA helicase PcrA